MFGYSLYDGIMFFLIDGAVDSEIRDKLIMKYPIAVKAISSKYTFKFSMPIIQSNFAYF